MRNIVNLQPVMPWKHWTQNVFAQADSYKDSHYLFYSPDLTSVSAYFESRGGHAPQVSTALLQYFLMMYYCGKILNKDIIDEQTEDAALHFGDKDLFNRSGFLEMLDRHGGYLPFSLWALPEGTIAPVGTPLFTVKSEDDCFAWLATYVETTLANCWYPNSVGTNSLNFKLAGAHFLDKTGDLANLPFLVHDFGQRGVTCPEQAGIGGAAHLMHFMGSDNRQALRLLKLFYDERMAGYSVAASEHSCMGSWGGPQGEDNACENAVDRRPNGILSVVSDTYNIRRAIKEIWGGKLKDKVLARNGKTVIRLDSGEPREEVFKALSELGDLFGYARNAKGYKVLHPKIGILQGDGVNKDTFQEILYAMANKDWSADNIVFGSGGGLLQSVNRDTHKFAYKANAGQTADGAWRDIYKDPITDPGKRSKRGQQAVVDVGGKLVAVPLDQLNGQENKLVQVVDTGRLVKKYDWKEVRANADSGFQQLLKGM